MIHPKTLLISRHFYSLESYVSRSIYNLTIDTISTYNIPLDRSFLKLWNGIRHVMPSTDRRLELKEKTSMAQNAWQAFVYANGLNLERAPETSCANYLTINKLCSPPKQCVDTLHMFLTINMSGMVFVRKGVLTANFCVIQANVNIKQLKNVLATLWLSSVPYPWHVNILGCTYII